MWRKPNCKCSPHNWISEATGNDLSCTGSDLNDTVYYKDNSIIYFKADEIKEIFTDANKKGDGKLDMDGKCGQFVFYWSFTETTYNHFNPLTSK